MAVSIDLRRDLPKVRAAYPKVMAVFEKSKACDYAGPCIVGAMVPQQYRKHLDYVEPKAGSTSIDVLIKEGFVTVPDAGQARALTNLQRAFDRRDRAALERALKRYEKKYLAGEQVQPC